MDYFTLLIGTCNIGQTPFIIYQTLIARKQLVESRHSTDKTMCPPTRSVRQADESYADGFEDAEIKARSIKEAFKLYRDKRRAIRQGDMLTDYEFVEDFWRRVKAGGTLVFVASICFMSGVLSPSSQNLLVVVSTLPGITGFCIFQMSFVRLRHCFPARTKAPSTK